MKTLLILLVSLFSSSAWSLTKQVCDYGKFKILITDDKENDIYLEIFKDKMKVSACHLKVISYEDGKRTASFNELIRFEKIRCDIIYDKLASDVVVIDHGYIKRFPHTNSSSAYVINNKQPLRCNTTKKL